MRIAIRHQMTFAFDPEPLRISGHLLVTPRSFESQRVHSWNVAVEGAQVGARFRDAYGNAALLVGNSTPGDRLGITVEGLVETIDSSGVVGRLEGDPVPALFRRVTPLTRANVTLFSKFRGTPTRGPELIDTLHGLMLRIGENMRFGKEDERDDDERDEATAADFAHAFIGGARALGIPARYVTGYVAEDGDLSATHAWAEAFDENLGWIGFDAALGRCPTDAYVRVAVGLDATSAIAVRCVPAIGAENLAAEEVAALAESAQ
ncbi:MAG TPA: transglutaminase family protein [Devosiaceae bacterium]